MRTTRWLTTHPCPLHPWGPSGRWDAEVDRRAKGAKGALAGMGHWANGAIMDCPTTALTPSSADRTPRRRERCRAIRGHPRQHVEDDADGQNKLRCNTEECTEEDLTCQHQREPVAVERRHHLAGGHEAQEQLGGLPGLEFRLTTTPRGCGSDRTASRGSPALLVLVGDRTKPEHSVVNPLWRIELPSDQGERIEAIESPT